jgi:hypothetical protein
MKPDTSATTRPLTLPYPPSWFDRLLDFVDGLPGPVWVYLVALLLITFAYQQIVLWLNGSLPFPVFDPGRAFYLPFAPYVFGVWLYFRRVAREALAKLAPLLQMDGESYARLEYQLTRMPARSTWFATALVLGAYVLFLLFIPRSYYQHYGPSPEAVIAQLIWIQLPAMLFSTLGLYRAAYILGQVNQILRRVSRIDLYQTSLLYTFSSFTAQIGVSLLAPVYYLFAVQQELVVSNAPLLGLLLLAIPVTVASFLLPLREMHNRIVHEKASRLNATNSIFQDLTAQVHRAVNANELQEMDGWNKALSNLVIERDALERIPTWPWERGTLTGFLTALILPIVLWLITRILERLV